MARATMLAATKGGAPNVNVWLAWVAEHSYHLPWHKPAKAAKAATWRRKMNQNQPTAPACPVPRCGTKTPHTTSLTVQAFTRQSPADVIDWTKRCIVELIQSVIDDVNKGRIFAYLTRWRDPEELYKRVLYAMFVAPADHLHIFFQETCPTVSPQCGRR
jgi:hypothetical protein